jgi:hypothetical protein
MATEDGDELMSLLASAGDEDLGDIQSLLDSDENGEAVDETALLQATSVEDIASGVLDTPEEAKAKAKEDKKAAKAKAKEEKKAAKAAKRAAKGGDSSAEAADGETDAPKQGFFARILNSLTESLDEEDEAPVREAIPDDVEGEIDITALAGDGAAGGEMVISDENKEILDELDKEKGKKKGKKKKKKKDKGKKADDAGADEEGEEGEGGGKKEKKKKPKKEKKPKNEEPEKPGKKLNKKKVISIFALCATILVAVLVVSKLLGAHAVKQEAREAYSVGDYQTAYQDLFGQDLNESDQIIFKKSECILRIRLWYREYELLRDESDVKALDSLIQSVNNYPGLYESAVKWQCLEEVEPVYNQIVEALYNEFGLTEEEAREIAMIKKDVDYTRAVYDVVNGNHGNSQDAEAETEDIPETPAEPEDLIPGEEDPGDDIIFVNP